MKQPVASLVADPTVGRAIANIVNRAEMQPDGTLLEDTFVDTGILPQLETPNSRIVIGRQGTGKSHVLRVLLVRRDRDQYRAASYHDLRNLGSAQLITGASRSLTVRCVSIFRDLLGQLQSRLLDLATDPRYPERAAGLESVSGLADAITLKPASVHQRSITSEHDHTTRQSDSLHAILSAHPSVVLDLSKGETSAVRLIENYREVFEDTLLFSSIGAAFDRALGTMGISSFSVLLDEWTAIPPDVQPYFAEFLRRTLLTSPRVNLTIASLGFGALFTVRYPEGGLIGLDLTRDVAPSLDLDDHYASQLDQPHRRALLEELLYRHLQSTLREPHYLASQHGIGSPHDLVTRLMDAPAFDELARVGRVVRDFLAILTGAYFRAAVARRPQVAADDVAQAARTLFENQTLAVLTPEQERIMVQVSLRVRDTASSDLFALGRAAAGHPLIAALVDLGVFHVVRRAFAAPAADGRLVTLYRLDEGACLALGISGTGHASIRSPDIPADVLVLDSVLLEPAR